MGRRQERGRCKGKGSSPERKGEPGIQSHGVGGGQAGILKGQGRGSVWRGFCSWSAEEEGAVSAGSLPPTPYPLHLVSSLPIARLQYCRVCVELFNSVLDINGAYLCFLREDSMFLCL